MLYASEVRGCEQNIIKQAMRFGTPIPNRMLNAPKLMLGSEHYLNAFYDLDTERNFSVSLSPIPWSSINKYAQAYGFDDEELQFIIRKVDNAYLKDMSKKQNK